MHEQLEGTNLIVVDLIREVELSQELTQCLLIVLYRRQYVSTEPLHGISNLTLQIVVKQGFDNVASQINVDRLVYLIALDILGESPAVRGKGSDCGMLRRYRTHCAFCGSVQSTIIRLA